MPQLAHPAQPGDPARPDFARPAAPALRHPRLPALAANPVHPALAAGPAQSPPHGLPATAVPVTTARRPADGEEDLSLACLPQFLLPGSPPPTVRRAWLDAGMASAQAREFTRHVLLSWGLLVLCEDATIVVSELVTNALRHGARGTDDVGLDGIELVLCRRADLVACAVVDPGTEPPLLMAPDPAAETGRGLHVVEALSTAWGWTRLGGQRKAVWATLRVPYAETEGTRHSPSLLAAAASSRGIPGGA
jgi:anti-sigma regulatory factor (Ser/Thr protein kinase)